MRQFLLTHSREELAEWILGVAKDSSDFRQRLEFYAGTHTSPEVALESVRRAIAEFGALVGSRKKLTPASIVKTGRFLLEAIRACLDYGFRDEMLGLIEHVMVALDQMVANEKPQAQLDQLQREYTTLYLSTCELLQPEPLELAKRLFGLRENAEANLLPDVPARFATVLGVAGLRRFRELLEPTYRIVAKLAAQTARTRTELRKYSNRRMMLYEWAVISEDFEEQVTILLAMARLPDEVLRVADFLDARQRPMDAIQAVKKAYEQAPSPSLARYLATRLEAQQQVNEALEYRWFLFEKDATRESYDALLGVAAQTGHGKLWRDRAMEFAEEHARGLYVDVLLLEGQVPEALAAVRESGAPILVWATLAELHAAIDPQVAIGLYFDCVDFAIAEGKKSPRTPEEFVNKAWELASDTPTFQIFNSRLRMLFGKERLPGELGPSLELSGIPVGKLLQ